MYLDIQLEYFANFDSTKVNQELNNKMKKMFEGMRKSLIEEIGTVNKDFLKNK